MPDKLEKEWVIIILFQLTYFKFTKIIINNAVNEIVVFRYIYTNFNSIKYYWKLQVLRKYGEEYTLESSNELKKYSSKLKKKKVSCSWLEIIDGLVWSIDLIVDIMT